MTLTLISSSSPPTSYRDGSVLHFPTAQSATGLNSAGQMNTPAGAADIDCPSNLAVYQEFTRRIPKQHKVPRTGDAKERPHPVPSVKPMPRSSLPQPVAASVLLDQHGKSGPPITSLHGHPTPFVRSVNVNGPGCQTTGHYYPDSIATTDSKGWDVFRTLPPPPDNLKQSFWVDVALQMLKLFTFFFVCCLLLGSAMIAKGTFLLMTSAVGFGGRNTSICSNPRIGSSVNSTVVIEHKHIVKWVWSLYIALCIPEILCFVRCLHRVLFRNVKKPKVGQFFLVFIVETLHAVGVGMLVFKILPGLDAVTGAMLANCFCFVPAVLTLLSRKTGRLTVILVFLDILSIAAQSSGFWAWPVFIPELAHDAWAVPAALCLVSVAWWPNFVHVDSVFPFVRKLARTATALNEKRSKTYVIVSLWKCLIYFSTLFAFISMRMSVNELLQPDPFGHKPIQVVIWRPQGGFRADPNGPTVSSNLEEPPIYGDLFTSTESSGPVVIDTRDFLESRTKREIFERNENYVVKIFYTTPYDALWVVLVQAIAAYSSYQCAKFACKVMMQRFGFALPLSLVVPLTVFTLAAFCAHRQGNICYMSESLPLELFWRCSSIASSVHEFFTAPQTWIWFVWFLSQLWVTAHLWMPQCERLAKTETLFVLPWYSSALTDQSLSLNRRRNDKLKIRTEDIELEGEDGGGSGVYETISAVGVQAQKQLAPSICSEASSKMSTMIRDGVSPADAITKIYACATMWHESPIEMMCMLKSIFRLDEDQSARRNAQKYLKIIDPDYYEFDAHIFFDDAFETNEYGEPVINKFVHQLLDKIDQAASAVHQTQMRLKPPKKLGTPYGGRLVWTLPGKNRFSVHLKDKTKIRHRKRWSQVMYMYFLLGYRLMQKVEDQGRKELISENTFILTLDGDVDFKPSCVHLLVDLMKKNRRLGAACGRIHPRGSGLMVWYQKFEYAIGHWFQKATEHMIGCVLCSPGCFSLFRTCAIMDDNVAKRYATKSENPKDYIQYDQGEDRWLCTLLLQRGYRVEYCAASDALTFAPEGFNEFFNQRRRWIPSTIANIVDLLVDYKNVVHVNESISIWYIAYQFIMLISSILGPGTIFLMVVGAISISFNVDTAVSFLAVVIPVIFFSVVCLTCKSDKQLLVAQMIGALFAMLMTAVIVGTALQIKKDGIYSPHAIFLFAVILSFFIAACLHPLEFTCIIPGILYFLAIPCMYMLLPVYSICNLNVVTWGTRENPKPEESDGGKSRGKGKNFAILEAATLEPAEIDGVYSVGCGNVCRFLCCLQPSTIGNSPQMARITQQLEQIDRKMDKLERRMTSGAQRRSSLGLGDQRAWENHPLLPEEDEVLDDHFDLPSQDHDPARYQQLNESWLNQKCLKRAERDFLEAEEENFWKEAIDKYLYPLKLDRGERERIKAGLGELRNKVTFAFFMLNALFILIVFLLQLKKDCLHVEWPFGPMKNHSMTPCNSDVREEIWVMTRLQMEPIGLVFLIFFVSILVLQFLAMLLHRFGTLSHILASTELFCFRKTLDKISEDELVVQNAVEIARELQAIRGVDEEVEQAALAEEQTISRRRVVHNLESSRRSMMKRRTETLDAAFKKRFFALSSGPKASDTPVLGPRNGRFTMRKGTIRALEQRRQTVFGTLDHSADNPYSDGTGSQVNRGPARRRLDRIFLHKNGDARQGSEECNSSSDEEGGDFKELPVTKGDQPGGSQTQSERATASTAGHKSHPLRKLVSQNVFSKEEHHNGLLPARESTSSASSTSTNPETTALSSHF